MPTIMMLLLAAAAAMYAWFVVKLNHIFFSFLTHTDPALIDYTENTIVTNYNSMFFMYVQQRYVGRSVLPHTH